MKHVPSHPQSEKNDPSTSLPPCIQLVYALQALCFFLGFTPIIGLILNLVKKEDAQTNPLFKDHVDYQLKTFFIWAGLMALGLMTVIIVIGVPILFGATIFMVYRAVKGLLAFNKGFCMKRQSVID